jgi:SAM-dependent methyltransferase
MINKVPGKEFTRALADYRKMWPNDGYFDQDRRFDETFRLFTEFYTGGRVLDVGGWPGDFALVLSALGIDVAIIDRDPARQTAKAYDSNTGKYILAGGHTLLDKAGRYGVGVMRCDIEMESLPVRDASAGFVIFTEVIEHLRLKPLAALRELRRVLSPGGRMLLSTPNLLTLRNRASFALGLSRYDTLELPYDALEAEERVGHSGHYRVFSMAEMKDLLIRTGFKIAYSGYRHFVKDESKAAPSLYALRRKAGDILTNMIAPVRNSIVIVAEPDGKMK